MVGRSFPLWFNVTARTVVGHYQNDAGTLKGRCRETARTGGNTASTMPRRCKDDAGSLPGRWGDTARTMPGRCHDDAGTLPRRCRDMAKTVVGRCSELSWITMELNGDPQRKTMNHHKKLLENQCKNKGVARNSDGFQWSSM